MICQLYLCHGKLQDILNLASGFKIHVHVTLKLISHLFFKLNMESQHSLSMMNET